MVQFNKSQQKSSLLTKYLMIGKVGFSIKYPQIRDAIADQIKAFEK